MSIIKIFSDSNTYKDNFQIYTGSNSEQILLSINQITKTEVKAGELYQLTDSSNIIDLSSSEETLDFENKCIYISGSGYKGLIIRSSINTNSPTIKNLNIYIYGDLGEEETNTMPDPSSMMMFKSSNNNCGGIIQPIMHCFSVSNCNVFISGNIVGKYAGGICGSNCGAGLNGDASITDSNVFIYGSFTGANAGSICGAFCGKGGIININNCQTYCNDTRTQIVDKDSNSKITNSNINKTTDAKVTVDPHLKIIADLEAEDLKDNQRIADLEEKGVKDNQRIADLEEKGVKDGQTIAELKAEGVKDGQTIAELKAEDLKDNQRIADLEAKCVKDGQTIADLKNQILDLQIQIDKMKSSSCFPLSFIKK